MNHLSEIERHNDTEDPVASRCSPRARRTKRPEESQGLDDKRTGGSTAAVSSSRTVMSLQKPHMSTMKHNPKKISRDLNSIAIDANFQVPTVPGRRILRSHKEHESLPVPPSTIENKNAEAKKEPKAKSQRKKQHGEREQWSKRVRLSAGAGEMSGPVGKKKPPTLDASPKHSNPETEANRDDSVLVATCLSEKAPLRRPRLPLYTPIAHLAPWDPLVLMARTPVQHGAKNILYSTPSSSKACHFFVTPKLVLTNNVVGQRLHTLSCKADSIGTFTASNVSSGSVFSNPFEAVKTRAMMEDSPDMAALFSPLERRKVRAVCGFQLHHLGGIRYFDTHDQPSFVTSCCFPYYPSTVHVSNPAFHEISDQEMGDFISNVLMGHDTTRRSDLPQLRSSALTTRHRDLTQFSGVSWLETDPVLEYQEIKSVTAPK